MKLITALALFLSFSNLYGQTFQKMFTWKDNSLSLAKAEWVDIDNDSLLDVQILAQGANQKLQLKSFKNQNLAKFTLSSTQELDLTMNSFSLADLNLDNRMDLVINGTKEGSSNTTQILNNGNFQFSNSIIGSLNFPISNQLFLDLDKDGKLDLVVGGETSLKIFRYTDSGYLIKLDSSDIKINSIAACDVNKDGKTDLIVSGNKNNQPFITLIKNKGSFQFQKLNLEKPVAGNLETGDFNHDGYIDVIVSGTNGLLNNQIKYYTNNAGKLKATDSLQGFQNSEMLLADVDSDGFAELSYFGKRTNGKKSNFIKTSTGSITELDTTQITSQRWGDYDRDGDLDLLQVRDSAGYQVFQVLENKIVAINKAPKKNGLTFSVTAFNKTIIYWDTAKDDRTPAKALSYDLLIKNKGDSKTKISPQFDITSTKRLIPSNGNQDSNNFAFIPNLNEFYNYFVQPVDNAFNGGYKINCYGGSCGKGGSCPDGQVDYVQACKGTNTTISSPEPAYWFSFKDGFKGLSSDLTFQANEPDTVVSVIYNGTGCPKAITHVVSANKQLTMEKQTKYFCIDQPTKLSIKPGWETVLWNFSSETSTKDSITLKITNPMTVNVTASTGTCVYKKEFDLRPSIVDLKIENEKYTISQGESIQLKASGGENYEWLPPTGLNNNRIANPLASPTKSTTYKVTATDSIECKAESAVSVNVQETAFAPTLFTPNGDGKNDEFKLYGLTNGRDFEFVIYNREGNTVYETTSISQVTSVGWNGTAHGTAQPAGVYYWKIVGTQDNDQPLRLNGKSKGSVLLVR
ncbi:MAG: VCBS repeat-containing protein [Cytophagales bacterium]|jgi:gliding motility-associated-like protein|nr:VCBS repeat-containing protein [Cytophagales bacterium]MCA6365706.1 VCBS repeat-containing protein [Cytophagales bacterium]MCA6370370.1 VCBS repeat-containing protein [Cytophagales bacterium]MCA6375642.1 VCBS repeat-containing protein [Cytophagales bacterium]MCA6385216.1 VCBS repeat-containing protein [Cytophagales bacterium]